ncbi:MAG: hypothetical protein ACRDJH_03335 [Thermomicrobiales bacterium]
MTNDGSILLGITMAAHTLATMSDEDVLAVAHGRIPMVVEYRDLTGRERWMSEADVRATADQEWQHRSVRRVQGGPGGNQCGILLSRDEDDAGTNHDANRSPRTRIS